MNKHCKMAFLIAASLLLLAGCITTQGAKSVAYDSAADIYTHTPSGFSFPLAIGHFQRDDFKFYNKEGTDLSFTYNLVSPEEKVVGTLYVYPSLREYAVAPVPKFGQTPDWFFNQHYDEIRNDIIDMYQAQVISESGYPLDRSLLNPDGKKLVIEIDTIGGETLFSHLYLFAHQGWFVKYRFTYPSKHNAVIEPEIENFISAFQWP